MESIGFYPEGIEFELENPEAVAGWISNVTAQNGYEIAEVSYIFLSDEALWKMNVEHLDHDTYTDIITFVLNEPESTELMVDMYVSVERVRDNAADMGIPFRDELHRVMIHGMLHAMGMNDKDPESSSAMRQAEDAALALRNF